MADEKLDTQIRREQIAEAALGLVAAQGVRHLSIAAVARRVGLVPSGIYRHFKSKDELLAAVLDRIEQRLLANVQEAREESEDPMERLKGILMRHIRFLREGKVISIPRMIFSEDVRTDGPQRKQRVLQLFDHYIGQVRRIVREGQSGGRIRQDVDVQTITMMLFGIIVPAGILWHLTEGGFDVTRHAQRSWQLFAQAVTNTADTSGSRQCE
jgi:AcrR family transcriptional regulator